MIPVFDGHNDALTRVDHGDLATGRSGGHVDLPRMAEGGMRGGIFAVFTPSEGDDLPLATEVPRATAAAHATAAAGRLAELERGGHVRIARGHGRPGRRP